MRLGAALPFVVFFSAFACDGSSRANPTGETAGAGAGPSTSAGTGGAVSGGGAASGASGGAMTGVGGGTAGGSAAGAAGSSAGGSQGQSGSASTGGAGNSGSGTSSGGSGSGTPSVRLVGRMDTTDAAGPRFAWSGSGLVARFYGTSVGVRLTGGQQYTVLIDGMLRPKLAPGQGVTSIATGLALGEHTVELYRRTEANQGESQFLGFNFGDGTLLPPPPAPSRRIEVIGDSITCGYGNEGPNMSCPFTPDTENHYLTYAAISARELNAELVTVAWSGKGMVCNFGDDATSCTGPLPDFYDRSLPDRATSLWNFASFQPHAVVINLGTNDFSTTQDPTQAAFEGAYAAFLERLRSKYADAWILCTIAPAGDGDLATGHGYIENAVARRNAMGDAKVKAFRVTPPDPADGFGCDYHPSLATHRKMATELSAQLKSTLGW